MSLTVAMPVLAGGRFNVLTTHVASRSIARLENVAVNATANPFDYTTDPDVDEHVFGLHMCGSMMHLVIVGYRTLVMLKVAGAARASFSAKSCISTGRPWWCQRAPRTMLLQRLVLRRSSESTRGRRSPRTPSTTARCLGRKGSLQQSWRPLGRCRR